MTLSTNVISTSKTVPPLAAFAGSEIGLEDLFDKQPMERFQPGETVFFEGDPARHVFEITEGVIRLCKVLVDGRRVISGFLFAGDIVGVSQKRRFIYSAEAVNGVKVRRINRRSLDEAVDKSSTLRPQVFARMCDEMAAVQDQMVLLSCKNAEERVSSFLASLMKRHRVAGQASIVIDLPMTRQDMADYLGMTIETVSRNLTKLAKKGVLANVERFSLRVLKPVMLAELSGGWWEDDEEDEFVPAPRGAAALTSHH
jgi:CRP/FNR family transcriptional regulator